MSVIAKWIRESNLIEGVDDPKEDRRSQLAWDWLKIQPELTIFVILDVHRRIMKKHLGEEAGNYRTEGVAIVNSTTGEIIKKCPAWSHVPILMGLWLIKWQLPTAAHLKSWLDQTREMWIREAHVDFEGIHPFIDGNGRTGRMILNWQRVKAKLKPLLIEAKHRGSYYDWFRGKE